MSLPKPPKGPDDPVSSLTLLVLTYEDLAKIMRCSTKTLKRLVSKKTIPHRRLGDNPAHDVRFYWPAIEVWLQGGKRT